MTSLPKTRTRIQVQRVWPMLDCGRYPVKRSLGDQVEVWADVFSDGHDVLRAVVRYRPPGARRWIEAPMEPIGNDRWHGSFPVDALGRWQYTITAWIDRWASWRWEIDRKLEGGQKDLSSELLEGAALAGVEALTLDQALDPALAPKLRREHETTVLAARSDRRPRAGALRQLVRALPALVGRLRGRRGAAATARRARLRRRSTCRRSTRSAGRTEGQEQQPRGRAGRSRQPVGDRRPRRRAHRDRSGARHARRLRPARRRARRSSESRSRSTSRSSARPTTPGSSEHPGMVPPSPGRDAQVRREPAQALPGHLQRQLRLVRLGGPLARAPRRRALLGRPRRQGLPGRQPAYEAGRVLGVADPRGAGRAPGRRLPRRGVHAARR